MRIRTQFIITMLLFGLILVFIAASAVIMHQRIEKIGAQEDLAAAIAQGASELSYLASDYLIYRENQQLSRWQSRFESFSRQVASLNVGKPDHQTLVRNIQANQQRLKEVFDSTVSAVGSSSSIQKVPLDLAFFHVSWSRMAVQSQGLVSDASRLSQLLHYQMDQLTEARTVLMYVMVGLIGAFLLASYMLTYRYILKSIMTLQAGTAVIGSGNLDFKIEEKRNDEIGDLAHAFNQMSFNLKTVTASKADLEREVTERKRAEEELREQREWLRVTLSSIGDAVIATDTEGRITFLNPVAVTLTGWPLEEALTQPLTQVFRIINEKTRQPAEDLGTRVLTEKRVVGLANDTALIARDGREVPIEDSAAPIKDATGNVTGAVLVFYDVTAKRRAQAALRESHERAVWLARFPEQNPNPIVRASADGTVLYCNPVSATLHGWTCEVGQLLQSELIPLISRAMAEGREVEEDVQLGERFYIVWVAPFPEEERYVNVYGRDITERKQAEEALHQSQKDLDRAQEVGQIGSWRLDVRRNVLTWSDENHRIFGVPKGTRMTYETFLGIVHPDDRQYVDTQWKAGLRGDPYDIEHRIVADGRVKWVREKAYLEFDDAGKLLGGFGITQDITERKQAEESLRQRTLELQQLTEVLELRVRERTTEVERANEMLRNLSSRIVSAHEEERRRVAGEIHDALGACLGAIKFKVEGALGSVAGDAPYPLVDSLRVVIPVIQEGIEECRRIQQDLRPSMLDDLGLLPTLSWFCRRFQTIYPGIRVEQQVTIREDEIPGSHKIVLYRVTQEAMNNIAKHSKADLVRLYLQKVDGRMELVLEDNGKGFDVDHALSSENQRRGLGLTSMKERVEFSGGSFAIKSTEGKGTIIRCSWPL